MKPDTKQTIKDAIETLLIGLCCFVFVSSINQSCSNLIKNTTDKKTKTEQIQKNIKYNKVFQKVR